MNSNFLCKVYGVRGYRVTGQCHKDNKTILKIERKHVKIREFGIRKRLKKLWE